MKVYVQLYDFVLLAETQARSSYAGFYNAAVSIYVEDL